MDDIKHWRQVVSADSRDMHFWDLIGRTPLSLTIQNISVGMTEGADPVQLIYLHFLNEKPLGINVSNAYLLALKYGDDPNKWIGKSIDLRIAECKRNNCIRVGMAQGTKLPKHIPRFQYIDDRFTSQNPTKLEIIRKLITDTGTDEKVMLAHYNLQKLEDIDDSNFQRINSDLQKKLQRQRSTKETNK